MEWLQVLTIVGSTVGCCWYFRKESKEQIEEIRHDAKESAKETRQMIFAIQQEMKDFHGRLERQDAEFKTRLCAIEEERTRRLFLKT